MAEPHESHCLFPVQVLKPGPQMDVQMAPIVVVVHLFVHGQIHAADHVDRLFKALEV